ncbi:MAG: bifunctional N(6)-L-threonylcarbamoyladenine synthase/serine/threonine protein kinase [archaeon]
MNILGIESTAHTLGIGVCTDEGEIISSEKITYIPESGGIVPREAAEYQADHFKEVLDKATEKGGLDEIDAFAFAQGPGLGPCLRIGATAARYLSEVYKKPLIGVNHCVAHIEIGKLATGTKDPVVLYVSGGNTQVIAYSGGRYRVFGETLDVAVGNCLDQFSRELGLQHPGGPKIEALALEGKNYIELPYVVKGMDLSFSGILTSVKNKVKDHSKEDLCYSFQETAFAMLTEVTERAMAHTEKQELLVTGGVAANQRLAGMLGTMCKERGAEFHVVPMEHAGDNGLMIAWTGAVMLKAGLTTELKDSKINQRFRTDQVDVTWM